ncbi:VOC family protein [Salinisphaera hydrothermalis]|uniref:VOC family protein n=1 Tax=Salinisphaera hydrothermalis TaxID=563188 RepID=UPI0033418475
MNASSTSALTIERVELVVRNLRATRAFYENVLGLHPVSEQTGELSLGAGGRGFLRLIERPDATPSNPRAAGLFHTAFLMPSRGELARWLRHVLDRRVRLDGASDHLVSEAIYLQDPEGNGVEVYADRPRAVWGWQDGQVRMATAPLDVRDLLAAADERQWSGVADTACIGHVHLQVGDTTVAEQFFGEQIGLDLTCRYPSASFFSRGGYHHHIAANSWNSAGAVRRAEGVAGLQRIALGLASGPARATEVVDPWGMVYQLAPRSESSAA